MDVPDPQSAPLSASAQVVEHVKESIRSGRMAPGQRLIESELSGRLHVSRGPVREALAQLQVEGFVDVEPHRGARVHQMSRAELADVFHVRALLAGEAARLAAESVAAGADRAPLTTELQRQLALWARNDASEYAAANVAFHAAVAELSGNHLLVALLSQLQTRVAPFLGFAQLRDLEGGLADHARIADAILAGDGPGAALAMRSNVNATMAIIRELPQTWFD
jgi:DNA-binding GntR family transcriptional regulator